MDIPEFHSGHEPEVFLDWINTVEEMLDFGEVPDCRRVPCHHPISWPSSSLVATRGCAIRLGKTKAASLEKLKETHACSLLTYSCKQMMYGSLQNLQQGACSVEVYMSEFLSELEDQMIPDTMLVCAFLSNTA